MVKVKKEMVPFAKDEYPKAGVTADSIAKLKGAFPVGPESPNPVVVNTFEPTGCQDARRQGQPSALPPPTPPASTTALPPSCWPPARLWRSTV